MTVDQLKGKTVGAAVSGGLDSCTITRWLVDNGVNVVCFTADLGQPDERNMDEICERMLACGAQEAVIVDAKDELAMAGNQGHPIPSEIRRGILEYHRYRPAYYRRGTPT